MRRDNQIFVNNQNMSASFNSSAVALENYTFCAIQGIWTGTPQGNLKIQATVDPVGTPSPTWDDIDDTSVDITTAGSRTWNLTSAAYEQVRLVFTKTGGSGSITVRALLKGF